MLRTFARAGRSATQIQSRTALCAARSFGSTAARSSSLLSSRLLVGSAVAGAAYWMYRNPKPVYADAIPHYGVPGTKNERTFIAIKPDGVQRAIVGEVIKRFEAKGYKLVAIKVLQPSLAFAQEHYYDLRSKPFYPGLTQYFSSGPIVAMVWEGKGCIKGGRSLVGATNPNDALPGSIRGDLCIEVGRNAIHGSDSPEAAKAEISLWFKPEEVCSWTQTNDRWVYEK